MYRFDEFFDAYGFDDARLTIATNNNLLEPFSRVLAFYASREIETEEYKNYTHEFLLEKLEEYKLDYIYSGDFTMLTFGQALSLYFCFRMGNFSPTLTEKLLQGSNIKLSKAIVLYKGSPPQPKDWFDEKQVKLVEFIQGKYKECYIDRMFFFSKDPLPKELPIDTIHVMYIEDVFDILFEPPTSQGIIKADRDWYQHAVRLLSHLPGWSLIPENNELYADCALTYISKDYYGTYNQRNISRKFGARNTFVDIFAFLKQRGLGKHVVPTYRFGSQVPSGNYDVREFYGKDIKTNVTSFDNIKEYPRQILLIQKHIPNPKYVERILVIASWDLFWYNDDKRFSTELEETIMLFFRGLAFASENARYGYFPLMLQFFEVDGTLKLFNINSGSIKNFRWEAKWCIKYVAEKSDCKLLLWEHVNSQTTFDQYKELVQTPITMQFVGRGVALTDEIILENTIKAYQDAFEENHYREYFNWFLVDNDNNLLVYTSIFRKGYEYEIRIIARVKGYARKALTLTVKEFFSKNKAPVLLAKVDRNNKASVGLFDSLYPSWKREDSDKMITYKIEF